MMSNTTSSSLWDEYVDDRICMMKMAIACCNLELVKIQKRIHAADVERRRTFAKLTHAKCERSSIWAQLPVEMIESLFKRSEELV
jgi:hypothetical protein